MLFTHIWFRFKLSAQECPVCWAGICRATYSNLFQEEVLDKLLLPVTVIFIYTLQPILTYVDPCSHRPTDTEARIVKIRSNGFFVFVPK